MNVQDLIDILMKVEDKSLKIVVSSLPDGEPYVPHNVYVGHFEATYDSGLEAGKYVSIDVLPDDYENKVTYEAAPDTNEAEEVKEEVKEEKPKFEGETWDEFLKFSLGKE